MGADHAIACSGQRSRRDLRRTWPSSGS